MLPTTSPHTCQRSKPPSINTSNDSAALTVTRRGRSERCGCRCLRCQKQPLTAETRDRQVQHAALKTRRDATGQPIQATFSQPLELHHASIVEATEFVTDVARIEVENRCQGPDARRSKHKIADDLQTNPASKDRHQLKHARAWQRLAGFSTSVLVHVAAPRKRQGFTCVNGRFSPRQNRGWT